MTQINLPKDCGSYRCFASANNALTSSGISAVFFIFHVVWARTTFGIRGVAFSAADQLQGAEHRAQNNELTKHTTVAMGYQNLFLLNTYNL